MPRKERLICTCLGCNGGDRANAPPHQGACTKPQQNHVKYGSYCPRCAPNYLCVRCDCFTTRQRGAVYRFGPRTVRRAMGELLNVIIWVHQVYSKDKGLLAVLLMFQPFPQVCTFCMIHVAALWPKKTGPRCIRHSTNCSMEQ